MKRRSLLRASGLLGLVLSGWGGSAGAAQPGYRISAEQLEHALARRFPLRQSLGGLLNLDLKPPRLRLLPERNRIGSEFTVDAAGPALGRSYRGVFDLDFALRYESSDQSIRAHQLHLNSLRVPGLSRDAQQLLESHAPALAEHALHEVVLHRLRPQDLALADGLGLEPDSITVVPEGLVIGFAPKQSR